MIEGSESIRKRVYGPGEPELPRDFYERKHDITDRLPINNTIFRQMERKYKNKSKLIDMTEVLDFQDPEKLHHLYHNHSSRIKKLLEIKLNGDKEGKALNVYSVVDIPGFYYIPSAIEDYKHWIERTFESYMDNTTNLNVFYDCSQVQKSLYQAYLNGDQFIELYNSKSQSMETVNVELLIRKIRWAILGLEYDWSTKEYNFGRDSKPFPKDLADRVIELVSKIGFSDYKPEAGIVNYYQLDDTLTGHVDRSEPNMEAPLVSISFGNSAIFLLGGLNRDDPVTPIIVRNGDISILSGPCRRYYHGIPKILNETTIDDQEFDESPFMHLIKNSRININIRQVY